MPRRRACSAALGAVLAGAPLAPVPAARATFLNYSNCTNFGGRLEPSAGSTGCASGATGVTAGTAGLVLSAALGAGLDPPLTPEEVRQVLTGTSLDIDLARSRGEDADAETCPSDPGWDLTFG